LTCIPIPISAIKKVLTTRNRDRRPNSYLVNEFVRKGSNINGTALLIKLEPRYIDEDLKRDITFSG
jgi:hypothetical protein